MQAARVAGLRAVATLVPSSNTVVERVTCAIATGIEDVSVHFSRIPLAGDGTKLRDEYDTPNMLAAAELLAHALPQVIVWNGSRGASLGFAPDRVLCDAITAATGIKAVSSALATLEILARLGLDGLALVSPLNAEHHEKMNRGFRGQGFTVQPGAWAGHTDNYAFATVPGAEIAAMVRAAAAQPGVQAVLTFNTNFFAAPLVAGLEAELGLPVLDCTAIGVWAGLREAGVPTAALAPRWGSVFAL